ncbi:MAG: MBL fold metallo-hydrolase [Bacteroidetes bacterium]|nr:MBL fold metallo-hydrolase [Bacteroidota bacterium]
MALFKSFGEIPSGARQRSIEKSSNYHNGFFQNSSPTLLMAEDSSMIKNFWKFLKKPAYTAPSSVLPSMKTNLHSLSSSGPVIIWFGHSSYLLRINNKNILVDPVLSGYASPFNFGVKSFAGSDVYSVDDLPDIDILILTHDHYDHLDNRTVLQLKPKVKQVCASLGVGSHLVYWGFDENIITELDWWQGKQFPGSIELTAAPARHFSGRSLNRNKTLWSSFVLTAPGYRLYLGGDSGYDSHFTLIGEKFGPFDIALLECGQYNLQWPQIHMMPEQTVQASIDLKAKVLFPVHWSKFSLALHPWREPIERVTVKAREVSVQLTTPMIGEPVVLNQSYPDKQWWAGI